jgi:hypothetical protein
LIGALISMADLLKTQGFIPATIKTGTVANTKDIGAISQKGWLPMALENCHWQGRGSLGNTP